MHIFKIHAHAVVHESGEDRPLTLSLVRGAAHTRILRQEEVYDDGELVLDYIRWHNNGMSAHPNVTQPMGRMAEQGWVIFQRRGTRTYTVAHQHDVETL